MLIYGGSFDPIHNGHINTAINVQKSFNFDRFIFLPCKQPVLKGKSMATAAQRVAMLQLALAEHHSYNFEIDTREIDRSSPSFMVTTLEDYRHEIDKSVALTLLMGRDTFIQIPRWHKWERLLKLSNILVINRPGDFIASDLINNLLETYETEQKEDLAKSSNGLIYQFNSTQYEQSSTSIRQKLSKGADLTADVSDVVIEYIKKNHLYNQS